MTDEDRGGTQQPSGTAPVPEKLTRLDGSAIKDRVTGRRVRPDLRFRQFGAEFDEDFMSDGTWKTVRVERALRIRHGTWQVVGDELCVSEPEKPTTCRPVWIDPVTDQLVMPNLGGEEETLTVLVSAPLT